MPSVVFVTRKAKGEGPDLADLIEVFRGEGTGKIKLNTRSGYMLIQPAEVVYCQADGNYTHIQLSGGNGNSLPRIWGPLKTSLNLESSSG